MSAAFIDGIIQQGSLFAIAAFGIALTIRILNWPDMTVDGSFTLGGAITATLLIHGHSPLIGICVALLGGALAGTATFFLNRLLGISRILSGILIMMILYSINLRIMGQANISLLGFNTVFSSIEMLPNGNASRLAVYFGTSIFIFALVSYMLLTRLGLFLRAVGDNEFMVQGLGVNSNGPFWVGLAVSNALVAGSGALVAQNQGFADVSMGTGVILTGLAALIVGEVAISAAPFMVRLLSKRDAAYLDSQRFGLLPWAALGEMAAAMVGSLCYYAIIAGCLELGLAPTDLKLATGVAVIAGVALKLRGPMIETYTRGRL